jgi:ATPase family associated with various cellular activities (AAA)
MRLSRRLQDVSVGRYHCCDERGRLAEIVLPEPPAAARPLVLQLHDLSFEELDRLRAYLERILAYAAESLLHFYDEPSGGFFHLVDPDKPAQAGDFSKASTATCISFLKRSGQFADGPWAEKATQLRRSMVNSDWRTAKLPKGNPFTASFLLESIHLLLDGAEGDLPEAERKTVDKHLEKLKRQLRQGRGGLEIGGYSRTAFLTHKAVRALSLWGKMDDVLHESVSNWVWAHLREESVLVSADNPDADVFEIAYSVILANQLAPIESMTPQQRDVLRFALEQFFGCQNPRTGGWPRSRPLFHYPKLGDAHCFDYELLVPLLEDRQLLPLIFRNLKSLALAADVLDKTKFPLRPGGFGWASGHHGQTHLAESWSTASVFHFCYELHRVVAEAIRRSVFAYVGSEYVAPGTPGWKPSDTLDTTFLDSPTSFDDSASSLRKAVEDGFVRPLVEQRGVVAQGRAFHADVAVGAILYGPPGTSKTRLARDIANCMAWPLLSIDPSHLTRKGLDEVHAEANRVFSMLESCEQVVIFMDELDELVRSREPERGELESRFLTTAMLPKLAQLNDRRRAVYLLATNHLEAFDVAIRRPGRFDKTFFVLPPNFASKADKWPIFMNYVESLSQPDEQAEMKTLIADLTYAEAENLAKRLETLSDAWQEIVRDAHSRATVSQPVDISRDGQTWKDRITEEGGRARRL